MDCDVTGSIGHDERVAAFKPTHDIDRVSMRRRYGSRADRGPRYTAMSSMIWSKTEAVWRTMCAVELPKLISSFERPYCLRVLGSFLVERSSMSEKLKSENGGHVDVNSCASHFPLHCRPMTLHSWTANARLRRCQHQCAQ